MDDALLHLRECEECLSTPSLGITKMTVSATDAVKLAFFQLPLSGSPLVLTLLEHILREVFQLPLSGSPSPIPGFFGSPRLSAAAPLRTNDF